MDSLLASWTSLTSIWKFNHIHTSLTSTFHFRTAVVPSLKVYSLYVFWLYAFSTVEILITFFSWIFKLIVEVNLKTIAERMKQAYKSFVCIKVLYIKGGGQRKKRWFKENKNKKDKSFALPLSITELKLWNRTVGEDGKIHHSFKIK